MNIRVTYDGEADAAYIYLGHSTAERPGVTVAGEEEAADVNLDFDGDGRLVGVEVLNARETLPPEIIDRAERVG